MVFKKMAVVPDVLRLGNLLRMGVLWLSCLIYSHLSYIVLCLRSPRRKQALEASNSRFSPSSPHLKPACIVTGASSGIGRATATALALRGFHVILAGRSLERLNIVCDEIETGSSGASCQALELDLCSVPSILRFVQTVKEIFEANDAPGTLQLLVNNAGILAASQRWTDDGVDTMTSTNYLGPYILTHELLPLLRNPNPNPSLQLQARIVNVVSFTHRASRRNQLDLTQLSCGGIRQTPDGYPLAKIYETLKLFMILYSYELHRQRELTRVSVMAADPGAVSTNILRELPSWLAQLTNLALNLLGLLQSPTAGARAVVAAALSPDEVSGKYVFGNLGLFCKSSPVSYDAQLGRQLWDASERLCIHFLDKHKKQE